MSKYNPYQTMHHTALYGGEKPKTKQHLYSLVYREQVIVQGAPYPVCAARKSELTRDANYNPKLFKIKRHE